MSPLSVPEGAAVTTTAAHPASAHAAEQHTPGAAAHRRTDPTAGERAAHQHEEAEHLLALAEASTDPRRRTRLQQEAVLLTLDLAEAVAHRYRGRGIDLEDLVQVGRMALVKAARGYRVGRGASFPAYAVPTISGEIKRYFRDSGWAVRPPRRLQEARAELGAREAELQQDLQREPSLREIADAMSLVPEDVREARACGAAYNAMSLDAPVPGTDSPLQLPADGADPYSAFDVHDALLQALGSLTERELKIVHLRFVEERTQAQIGEVLGVSQMQVSRLLAAILGRLREHLTAAEEGQAAS